MTITVTHIDQSLHHVQSETHYVTIWRMRFEGKMKWIVKHSENESISDYVHPIDYKKQAVEIAKSYLNDGLGIPIEN